MKVIIWADEPNNGLPVRDQLRSLGHTAMIRDARAFGGFSDVERCDALAFVDAGKRPLIIAEYRTPAAQERYGQVLVFDIETGDFGEPIGMPDIPAVAPEPKEPSESDLLNSRTDRLTDDDLRTFIRVKTGAAPPDEASREDMEALLRQVGPGAPAPTEAEQEELKRRVREITNAAEPEGSKEPPQEIAATTTETPPTVEPPQQPQRGRGGRGKPPVDKAD